VTMLLAGERDDVAALVLWATVAEPRSLFPDGRGELRDAANYLLG